MRRVALALTLVFAVSLMVGCTSVPEWVDKGSGAFPGDRGNAIYGVGVAASDPNPQLQRDMGRMNARTELARSTQAYVAELTKQFAQKHRDWFDEEHASSVEFFQQAAKQVTEATLRGSQEVNTWFDKGGDRGGKGSLYVLMMLPLDNKFFELAMEQYDAVIRRQQAALLKKEANELLGELNVELENARQAPFALTGPMGQ